MGMSEDDRIRRKNRHLNEAHELIEGLKTMGYDSAYIARYAQFAITNGSCPFRNEVYNTMIRIVRSSSGQGNTGIS